MIGNYNRYRGQIPRVKMTPPPGMNTDLDSKIRMMAVPAQNYQSNEHSSRNTLDEAPLGMAYVPWQTWGQLYAPDQGFEQGTIFPELDLPFMVGRCNQ